MNNLQNNFNLPKISIITVVYNSEKLLEQTILSVINQKYNNIEYIIIDGGSTDKTVEIIKEYKEDISHWVSEKDNGIYDAMNKALDVITGDWVYFLGAGDLLLNVLDQIKDFLQNDNTIYYGDVYRIDLLKVFNGKFSNFRASRMCICHQAIFYPAQAIKKYKFDTKYKVQGDHNLNMILNGANYIFKYFPIIVCIYEGEGFSAVTRDVAFFNDRLIIVRKNFPFIVFLYAYSLDKILKFLKRGEYRNNFSQ